MKRVKRTLSILLAMVMALTSLGYAPSVSKAETGNETTSLPDHVIINQVYGDGGAGDGAASHGFIELYNPTDEDVDLSTYSIQYSKGKENGNPTVDGPFDWNVLPLTDYTIKARHSFLIVCDSGTPAPTARYQIRDWDVKWEMGISNRAFHVALVSGHDALSPVITESEKENVVDLLGAKNTGANDVLYHYEGSSFNDVSKQKAARRMNFSDTDDNGSDFESIDYRATGISDAKLEEVKPRYSGDGAWGYETEDPIELPDHVIINQVYGDGGAGDGSASHGFIELYNPTNEDVDLSTYSIQYSKGKENSNPTVDGPFEWNVLPLTDYTIKARHSFLIVCDSGTPTPSARYQIRDWDVKWEMGISNRAFHVALVSGQDALSPVITESEKENVMDLLGAKNTGTNDVLYNYEGSSFNDVSKQKAARRIRFADTDDNGVDFESIDYRATGISDAKLDEVKPRYSGDGAWGIGGEENPDTDHVIINQVYGDGGAGDGAVSHGFIELYNPTGKDLDVSAYSVQYAKGKEKGGVDGPFEWNVLPLTGKTIKAYSSFLIRCDSGVAVSSPRYTINNEDVVWNQEISNRAVSVALVSNQNKLSPQITEEESNRIVDLVGTINSASEGDAIYNFEGASYFVGISKQKSARRIDFQDTDENGSDFTTIDYRPSGVSDSKLNEVRPRYSGDGAWGLGEVKDAETPEVGRLYGRTALQGYQASLAIEATVSKGTLSYQWYSNTTPSNTGGTAINLATGKKYVASTDSLGTTYYYCVVTNTDETAEGQKTVSVATEAVPVVVIEQPDDCVPDHVIINQAYGGADKNDGAISHGFIELYNPTDRDVDLSSYSIQYARGARAWEVLELDGVTIKSRCSFLILCDSGVEASAPRYTIPDYDLRWNQAIDNDSFNIALVSDQERLSATITEEEMANVVDLIGAINTAGIDLVYNYEGVGPLAGISKQKSARRIQFSDIDENSFDFEILDYRATGISDEVLEEVRPRYSGDGEWGIEFEDLTDAETPRIVNQPSDKRVKVGEAATLTVTASVSKGALSYQWYKNTSKSSQNGTMVNGATNSSYQVPTNEEGTSYYYCVVTNTDNTATGNKTASITSAVAEVTAYVDAVDEKTVAETPKIVSQPAGVSLYINQTATLSVSANVSKGSLSYQWYRNATNANTGGTPIQGATASAYQVPSDQIGITYYYCIVTNYDEAATSNQYASITSHVAEVNVREYGTGLIPESSYTVVFDSKKGSKVADQTVSSGALLKIPKKPTRKGYEFDGWYINESYKKKWNFKTSVTGNMTLYAKWTLAAPKSPKAKVLSRNSIRISWKKASIGVGGYDVYRSTKKNGKYKLVGTVTKGTTYRDKKLKRNKTYYYKVQTFGKNKKNREFGYFTKVVSGKTKR